MKTGLVMWWFASIFEVPPVRFSASIPGRASMTLSGSVGLTFSTRFTHIWKQRRCSALRDTLRPLLEADDMLLHRIIGDPLGVLRESLPLLDELGVGGILDRLEVI